MAYVDFKDLTRRIGSDKILKIRKMMDMKGDLLQNFIIFLIKNIWWSNQK